jgi:hypothetical protein
MQSIDVPASPRARVMKFLDAFEAAPNDADIEFRSGHVGNDPAIVVGINGVNYGLLATEAITVAEIMEDAMRKFPSDPRNDELPNMIMGLREAAKQTQSIPHPE